MRSLLTEQMSAARAAETDPTPDPTTTADAPREFTANAKLSPKNATVAATRTRAASSSWSDIPTDNLPVDATDKPDDDATAVRMRYYASLRLGAQPMPVPANPNKRRQSDAMLGGVANSAPLPIPRRAHPAGGSELVWPEQPDATPQEIRLVARRRSTATGVVPGPRPGFVPPHEQIELQTDDATDMRPWRKDTRNI